MATPEAALTRQLHAPAPVERVARFKRLDLCLLAGIAIALAAIILGLRSTGVSLNYFLQPTGAVIVLGGTFGVILVTTPRQALLHSVQRVMVLISAIAVSLKKKIDEIIKYARHERRGGIFSHQPITYRFQQCA